jgi:hypothetical protein
MIRWEPPDPVTAASSVAKDPPVASPDEEDEDVRPWRGVYTPLIDEDILFTTALELTERRLPGAMGAEARGPAAARPG